MTWPEGNPFAPPAPAAAGPEWLPPGTPVAEQTHPADSVPGGRAARRDPWSTVTLVSGVLGLFPITLGAAVLAIVRLRRNGRRGWGPVLGGLGALTAWSVLLVVATGVGVALVAAAEDGGPGLRTAASTPPAAVPLPDPPDAAPPGGDPVRVGACVEDDAEVACAQAHDAEVFLVEQMPDVRWPGDARAFVMASDRCARAFPGYVGISPYQSRYEYAFSRPTAEAWASGDRRLVCSVVARSVGSLDGSVAGAGH